MQRLTPNTVINNRFLLKEELSFDSQSGQQVWAVQDQQTDQTLVALLHADGRVEWFRDNRPPTATSVVDSQPEPSQKPSVVSPKPAPVSIGKRTAMFLVMMLLVGGLAGGYVYRESLLIYLQSLRSTAAVVSTDSLRMLSTTDSVPVGAESAKDTLVEAITPSTEPISDRRALRLLTMLKQIPVEKHAAIFVDSRRAFAVLRQTTGQSAYIDSLYTMCMGRGAQSFMAHQQNGDAVSKRYAIEWYQLAYALKPSSSLDERLTRLKSSTHAKSTPLAEKPKKAHGSLFIADPEVTQ